MLLAYGNYFKFKFFIQRYIVKQMLEIYIIIEKTQKHSNMPKSRCLALLS